MREIKFRGKDCSGQWVYGDLIHKRHDKESVLIQDERGLGSDVDTTTIGQYTGLKDKNGKEFYEGDIIKHSYCEMAPLDMYQQGEKDEWIEEVGVVKWDSNYCNFYTIAFDVNIWSCDDYEVIGNIYDNPELIKEEEQ